MKFLLLDKIFTVRLKTIKNQFAFGKKQPNRYRGLIFLNNNRL